MSHSKQNLRTLAHRRALFNAELQMSLAEKSINARLRVSGNSEAHVAFRIRSILRLLRRIMEDPEPPNVLFKNIRRRINGLQILKKGVPNTHTSNNGTPRPHTNALHR